MSSTTIIATGTGSIARQHSLFCTLPSQALPGIDDQSLQRELEKTHVAYQKCMQELLTKLDAATAKHTQLEIALAQSEQQYREIVQVMQVKDAVQQEKIEHLASQLGEASGKNSQLAAQVAEYERVFAIMGREIARRENEIFPTGNRCLIGILLSSESYKFNKNVHDQFLDARRKFIIE